MCSELLSKGVYEVLKDVLEMLAELAASFYGQVRDPRGGSKQKKPDPTGEIGLM